MAAALVAWSGRWPPRAGGAHLGLPVVTADDGKKGLEQRVAALETLLKHFSRKDNEVFITRANLHTALVIITVTPVESLADRMVPL